MSEIQGFSSRRQRLNHAFLGMGLREAKSYKRIAAHFRSSIQCECFAAISAQTVSSRM